MDNITLRIASPADAEALLELYAPYVRETAITFEYEVPSPEEFQSRIRRTLEKYPYLIAEQKGRCVGYAYAGAFHARAAYDWAVETSVYVERGLRPRVEDRQDRAAVHRGQRRDGDGAGRHTRHLREGDPGH